jgi:hypothetical protein
VHETHAVDTSAEQQTLGLPHVAAEQHSTPAGPATAAMPPGAASGDTLCMLQRRVDPAEVLLGDRAPVV